MSYADDELSQAAGEPIELYEFIGSAATWRYTSGAASAVHGGNTYAPLAGLIRTAIEQATSEDTPTLVVSLPSSAGVVAAYGYANPPRGLALIVRRIQRRSGGFEVVWQGDITSMAPRGTMAEVRCPSALGSRLNTTVPGLVVLKQCQHFLYDDRCRVPRASFDLATTVSSVSDRTVTVAGVGGNPDQWFRAGEIVRDSDGERRTIVNQVGGVLTIHAPFRALANGNAVTLYAGCDHTSATCQSKFGNRVNFSGLESMPKSNPFRVAIQLRRS